jgi:CubicO group peptidase (beta-lactamase class C family)
VVVAGGAAAIAADVAVDEDVDFELLLWLCEPASPMTISTAMTAKTMTHLGTDCFFFGDPPAAGGGAAGPEFLPSEPRLPASDGSGYQPGAGGGGCVIAETVRAPRAVCRGRLVGQLGLVHLQRATPGLAVLVRRSATRRSPGRAPDEHTTVVADLHPTQAPPELAWSAEPEPEPEAEPDPGPPLLLQPN